jgi:hypothetical protein
MQQSCVQLKVDEAVLNVSSMSKQWARITASVMNGVDSLDIALLFVSIHLVDTPDHVCGFSSAWV